MACHALVLSLGFTAANAVARSLAAVQVVDGTSIFRHDGLEPRLLASCGGNISLSVHHGECTTAGWTVGPLPCDEWLPLVLMTSQDNSLCIQVVGHGTLHAPLLREAPSRPPRPATTLAEAGQTLPMKSSATSLPLMSMEGSAHTAEGSLPLSTELPSHRLRRLTARSRLHDAGGITPLTSHRRLATPLPPPEPAANNTVVATAEALFEQLETHEVVSLHVVARIELNGNHIFIQAPQRVTLWGEGATIDAGGLSRIVVVSVALCQR